MAPAGQERRHGRRKQRRIHTFDPEHADVLLLKADEKMRDRGAAQFDGGKIEHDRLADEEAWRAGNRGVDFGKPIDDRHGRREHKSDIGAAAQTDRLGCGLCTCIHG